MAVIGTAYEKAGSPRDAVEDANGVRLVRDFIVKTTSRADGPVTVMGAAGLPLRGQNYATTNESHPYVFCVRRRPRRINEKSKNWAVECEYESPSNNQPPANTPEFELPVVRTDSYPFTVELEQDINGDPIDNSAGDPFKPAPKRTIQYPALYISRNEPLNSPILATQAAYQGKLNSDTFWGQPAGKWLCQRIRSSLESRPAANGLQQAFLRVDYEFHYAPSWKFKPLDKGYYGLIFPSAERVAFRTKDGQPIERLLNGGLAVEVPNYLEFDIYESIAFSGLNLPQSYLDVIY